MTYSEAISGYFLAYNTKARLLNDPLSESGVLTNEAAALTGTVELSQVAIYDAAYLQINETIPAQIAEQDVIMADLEPIIVELFATVAPTLGFVYSEDRTQKVSVVSGAVVIT